MTEKENYLKTLRGGRPEWVPNYRDACEWVFSALNAPTPDPETPDDLGIRWMVNEAGPMPVRGYYAMTDASEWRQSVHLPELDAVDWEEMAAQDLKNHDPNKAIAMHTGFLCGSFFIPLMCMMGFGEGLCAMVLDDEAVSELFEHFCRYQVEYTKRVIRWYKPDIMILSDDFCSAQGPLVSKELFEKMLLPYYRRVAKTVTDAGLILEIHVCGRCEDFIPYFADMGATVWQPAQPLNDLRAIRAKYGSRLVFNGTWDTSGPGGITGAPEETVRQSVRACMDAYAAEGGMVFWDGDRVGKSEDAVRKFDWLLDESRKYGRTFYKK